MYTDPKLKATIVAAYASGIPKTSYYAVLVYVEEHYRRVCMAEANEAIREIAREEV